MSNFSDAQSIPKVIYVMGIDGSGKTTVSEYLAEQIRARGYRVNILWLRFNHVFSKPLLGLCRILGLTRYQSYDGIRVGYHDFYRSRIISWLFVFGQYLDALRVKYFKILPHIKADKSVLILDRYVYDILVDVMVDTRISGLDKGRMGRKFKKLLPPGTLILMVDRELSEILEVRPEGKVDENFETRYQFYKNMDENDGVTTIKNDGSLGDLLRKAAFHAGLAS